MTSPLSRVLEQLGKEGIPSDPALPKPREVLEWKIRNLRELLQVFQLTGNWDLLDFGIGGWNSQGMGAFGVGGMLEKREFPAWDFWAELRLWKSHRGKEFLGIGGIPWE